MPAPTIIQGKKHFQSFVYEGNGGGQRVGNFSPFTDSGTIDKSVIIDKASSPRLSRTPSSAGNRKTFTLSMWVKRTILGSPRHMILTQSNSGGTAGDFFYFNTDNTIKFTDDDSSDYNLVTNRTFEDTSRFYHIVLAVDTTQGTAANRIKLYVDGDQITSFGTASYPAQDYTFHINNNVHPMNVYSDYGSSGGEYSDGYIAEVNLVDGTALTPSTFGLTDTTTGKWIPKTLSGITYGTNGFRLTFGNIAAVNNIGFDTSGNGHHFTVTNITLSDVTLDTPTKSFMNFTLNAQVGSHSLSEGNLKPTVPSGTSASAVRSTFRIPVGKWYFEYYIPGTNSVLLMMAVAPENTTFSARMHTLTGFKSLYPYTRSIYESDATVADTTDMPLAEDDTTYGVYIERKSDGTINYWVGDDQASKGTFAYSFSGNPATGANPVGSIFDEAESLRLFIGSDGNGSYSSGVRGVFNFGQLRVSPIDSGTNLTDYTSTAGGFFRFEPVSGFKALNLDNFPAISSPDNEFVDIAWIKNQDAGDLQQIYDSSRGPRKKIGMHSSDLAQQATIDDGLQKFLPKGFEIEDNDAINSTNESYVAWTWHVNAGTTSANSDGSGASIASTIQVNQDAGISIVTYDGSGSSGTIAHGLSQAPDVMFIKCITTTGSTGANIDWVCYHHHLPTPETGYIIPSRNYAKNNFGTEDYFGNTNPTNKVFSVAADVHTNAGGGAQYLAYCWHEVDGYSKMGKFEGNGSVNGPFVNTNFKPQYIWIKSIDNSVDWYVYNFAADVNTRNEYDKHFFWSNSTQTQQTGSEEIDLLCNGFKLRGDNAGTNQNGYTYVYMAFAEFPFLGDGVSPLTAQ